MAIDSYARINSMSLSNIDDHIKRINKSKEIEYIINVGNDMLTSKQVLKISKENPKFYSSIGFKPSYIDNHKTKQLYELAQNKKVVAIGEIGFSMSRNNYDDQVKQFVEQIEIANDLRLPVIINMNNFDKTIIRILKNNTNPKYGCVLNCDQLSTLIMQYIIDKGYYLSITKPITDRITKSFLQHTNISIKEKYIIGSSSVNSLTIDTIKEVKNIIEQMAELTQTNYKEIENQTTRNAKRLFKIKK
jgi:TatD DNase family protein